MKELTTWTHKMQQHGLTTAENRCLKKISANMRGFHLLLLGAHKSLDWLPKNCLYTFGLSPTPAPSEKAWVQASYEELPLRESSIDIVIVPYLLEYLDNPAETLKELFRCLMPEGKLYLLTFQRLHPWSWLNAPSSKKTLFPWQIKQLLEQAQFAIINTHWLQYGAITIIEAQKQVHIMTPLKPQWQQAPAVENEWAQPTIRKAQRTMEKKSW